MRPLAPLPWGRTVVAFPAGAVDSTATRVDSAVEVAAAVLSAEGEATTVVRAEE